MADARKFVMFGVALKRILYCAVEMQCTEIKLKKSLLIFAVQNLVHKCFKELEF